MSCPNIESKYTCSRDFPRPDLGLNNGPFPIPKGTKTSQNDVYHSQFLSSTFWIKISKLQMHEKLHKNVNENMFSFTFLCNFSSIFMVGNSSSFTLLISYMFLNPFKMGSSSSFPNLMVQMLFPQIQQAPGPDFRKVGKSLYS